MYKYMVDYLGGDHSVEHSNTKVAAMKKIHEKLAIKSYLTARLKQLKPSGKRGYYVEIKRYEMKFDKSVGKHVLKQV